MTASFSPLAAVIQFCKMFGKNDAVLYLAYTIASVKLLDRKTEAY